MIEKVIRSTEVKGPLPLCIDGAMNCPPEDSGGIFGYYDVLAAAKDPKHESHSDIKEWLGDFDSKSFSVIDVNKSIRRATR